MPTIRFRLSGTRALVLGGSCQLAIELARALMEAGITPVMTCRKSTAAEKVTQALRIEERPYETVLLDLDADGAAEADSCATAGPFDYLVDFAQADFEGLVASADMAAAEQFFRSNIAMRAHLLQRITRQMVRRRKGRLIFVSSTAAVRPNLGQGFYAAAKQAAEALYRNIGLELAERGVTAALVRPGYVDAGRGRRYLEVHKTEALRRVPLGRPVNMQEVVDTILFLLSDHACAINGTAVTVDGGLTAGK